MIVLNQNQSNSFVVTLTESVSLESPNFLFVFEHLQKRKIYAIVLTDISSYPERFNEFTLVEPTDLDFECEGQYDYTVYEQASAVNIDPDLSGAVVEVGIMILQKPDPTITAYDFDNSNNEIYAG